MKHIGQWLWWLFHQLYVRPYLKKNGLTVLGRSNLPQAGPAIIAVYPHRSTLEPAVIQALFPLGRLSSIIPTGAEDFFRGKGRVVYFIAKYIIGVCFLERGSGDKARQGTFNPFKEAKRHLAEGKMLILFPQGTRREGASLKKGVYYLHHEAPAGTVVVPVLLKGAEDLVVPGSLLPRPRHFTVTVRKPISIPEGGSKEYLALLERAYRPEA